MPFTWNVGEFRKDPNGNPYYQHTNDFVMFTKAEEHHLPNGKVEYRNRQRYFVQAGQVFGANGQPLDPDDVPEWVWEEYRRTNPATRAALGLKLPEDRQKDLEEHTAELLRKFDQLPDELKQALASKVLPQVRSIDEKAPKISGEASDTSQMLLGSDFFTDALKDDSASMLAKTWVCDQCNQEIPLNHKGTHIARFRKLGQCS